MNRSRAIPKHLVIQFARFGPYHFTRLRSAVEALAPISWRVSGLQTAGADATYAWDKTGLDTETLSTALPDGVFGKITDEDMRKAMKAALDKLKPDALAIAGWGTADARAALDWCRKNGATAIVMSETRAADGQRTWVKEWFKSRLIRRFDGALVGGQAHKDYLVQLGMAPERIRSGYDVVDNEHFARESEKVRAKEPKDEGRKRYFLASSRFIKRKNLSLLVDAYAQYMQASVKRGAARGELWDLVLLGTGNGREGLERYVKDKRINGVVFAGFQQIDTLPRWYAGAGAFAHAALEEPWGLVINEAMASGLPVICSRTTGAAELVEEGVNGFLFDPHDTEGLSLLLQRMASLAPDDLARMGANSARLIEERAPSSAFGRGLAELLIS